MTGSFILGVSTPAKHIDNTFYFVSLNSVYETLKYYLSDFSVPFMTINLDYLFRSHTALQQHALLQMLYILYCLVGESAAQINSFGLAMSCRNILWRLGRDINTQYSFAFNRNIFVTRKTYQKLASNVWSNLVYLLCNLKFVNQRKQFICSK